MKKKLGFLFLYCFLLFFSSKVYSDEGGVLRIGVALGFSGPIEEIVAEMYDVLEVVRLEAEETNYFKKIEFVKIDTKCEKSNFKTINNKINEKKLIGIIGAACPGITEIIVLNNQTKNEIPIISPSASSNKLTVIDENNLFFRTTPPNRRDAEVLADITRDKGIKSIAITFLNNEYGRGLEKNYMQALRKNSIEITTSVSHQKDKEDHSNEVAILAAGGGDAVAVLGELNTGTKNIIKSILDSGSFNRFIFSDRLMKEELLEVFGNEVNGSYGQVSGSTGQNFNRFIEIAKDKKINSESPFVGETYDAISILLLALQENEFNKEKKITDSLFEISNTPGTKVYAGELKKGFDLLKKGKQINYEGATNIELDLNGETLGTFIEKEIRKGKIKSKKQR